MSTHGSVSRNLLSLDEKLWNIAAVVDFGTSGAPLLKQWRPIEAGSSDGAYVTPAAGGCEGVIGVFKRGTADFRLVLMDPYVRTKRFDGTYQNSAHLSTAAPIVENVTGSMADLYPDLSSLKIERLEAGHSGLAVSSEQPKFTISGAEWPNFSTDATLTDSAGAEFAVLSVEDDETLVLAGTATPAAGTGWTLSINGVILFGTDQVPGTPSVTAFQPATFTVSGAGWLVNRWKNHLLEDYLGNQFRVASNTATVLTVESVASDTSLVASGMTGTSTGSVFTITGGGQVAAANAYVGFVFNDGVNSFYITANSALTATTGTITVLIGSPAMTVTAVGYVSTTPSGPVSGPYIINQGFVPGGPGSPTYYSITGPQITGSANLGTGTANTWTPAATTNWVLNIFAGMFLIDFAGVYWPIVSNTTSALTVANVGALTTPTTGASWSIVSVAGAASLEFTTSTLAGSGSGLTFTGAAHTLAGTNAASTAAAQLNSGLAANIVQTATAITATASANVVTIVSGGPTAAAHAYAGKWFTDGVSDFLIVDNTALTATSGTITVVGTPATTITATGEVYTHVNNSSVASAQAFTGESYTPAGTVAGTLSATLTPLSPAAGERLVLSLTLSDGAVMG